MKKIAVPLVIFVALIAGGIGASIWKRASQPRTRRIPRGAQFLSADTTPDLLLAAGMTRKPNKPDPLAEYQDLWVAEPGWEGTVQIIADESEGQTLRWEVPMSHLVGSTGYWMIVVLQESDSRVKVGSQVRVMGRFSDAGSKISSGSPVPQYRVILKNAKVLEVK